MAVKPYRSNGSKRDLKNSVTVEQWSRGVLGVYVPKSTSQVTSPLLETLRYLNRLMEVFPNKKSMRLTPRVFSALASEG